MNGHVTAPEAAEFCGPEWYESDCELFTQADAQAHVGWRVRDLVDFSCVPCGMIATVIKADDGLV